MKPVKSKPTFFLRDLLRSNHLLLDRIESGPILGCGAEGIALERFAEEVRVRSDNGSDEKRAIRWSHPAGLEIQALYEIFPDTRTVEISGRVANCGGKKLRHVRGPFSAFFKVDLHDLPAPRLTWFNGATDVGGSYPPSAYQVQEADLPFEGSVNLHGGSEGGRSTETLSPYLFVTIPERRQGFWLALEWPCRWIIGASHRGIPERERHLLIYAHAGWTDFDLEPGGSVAIPKITMGFYKGDAVDGSNAMRRHISRHVRPSLEDGSDLPAVFYNSFYEFGDAFTTESLKRRVDVHAEMGVEYFVLDAGWFQGGFRKGIGNWETEDLKKLPGGMVELARYVEKKGMKFGCWTEIEFAMADSDWATRHPEWYRSAPHRQNLFGALPRFADRLLRLDDPAVRAAVGDYLENWVNKNHIRWLRWDFNNTPAPFWEAEESEHEMGRLHLAYGEGLYVLRDDFMARCPSVHIETDPPRPFRVDE
jgi:hypothetical protein